LACLIIAVSCVEYQAGANRDRHALLRLGQRTQGTLQNITITRHLPWFWWRDYSFEVSYVDQAGAGHQARMEANAKLLAKHTVRDGKFTHHLIEVAFLPDNPTVAALPEALGGSIWGYVFAAFAIAVGFAYYWIWRHELQKRPTRGGSG
jgi:hypothetical protein